jgi:phosphoribosylaminoimidazole-succinocarboxamide synthase
MPIDEKLLTPDVLKNTLKKEIYSEVKVQTSPRIGKVRTVYDIGNNNLIMISSDDLSTHDVVHKRQVYAKGENLDAISSYYFEKTRNIIQNHFLKTLAPNTWLVQKADPILIEMVFRSYITGSAWKEYEHEKGSEKGMMFCGVFLKLGYKKNERLDEFVFTPSAKGRVKDFFLSEFTEMNPEEDDPKITKEMIYKNFKSFHLRKPEDLDFIVDIATKLYDYIHKDLELKGYLLADTKWEFGYFSDGSIGLIDECVTPDSSRIWNKEKYTFNTELNEFTVVQDDKQHFRDYVEQLGLHRNKIALAEHWMDDAVLKLGIVKYCNIREIITGTLPIITPNKKKEIILNSLRQKGYLKI